MARIVGGSMIGELSGKLGGNVFARNKAGAYIRQYVVPVNPNSIAQVNARSAFGSASSTYHSLDSTQKNQWSNFAQNLYLPKHGVNTGQYSGFNAFVSLQNTTVNAQRLQADPVTITIDGTPNVPSFTGNFSTPLAPPSTTIQSNLKLVSGGTTPIYLAVADVTTAGIANFTISVGGGITPFPQNIDPTLQDGNSNPLGWALYASNPVQQEQMFITNPEIITLGVVPPVTLDDTPPVTAGLINFSFNIVDPANYQNWYSVGDWVRYTLYAVAQSGQQIRVGSVTRQITT